MCRNGMSNNIFVAFQTVPKGLRCSFKSSRPLQLLTRTYATRMFAHHVMAIPYGSESVSRHFQEQIGYAKGSKWSSMCRWVFGLKSGSSNFFKFSEALKKGNSIFNLFVLLSPYKSFGSPWNEVVLNNKLGYRNPPHRYYSRGWEVSLLGFKWRMFLVPPRDLTDVALHI